MIKWALGKNRNIYLQILMFPQNSLHTSTLSFYLYPGQSQKYTFSFPLWARHTKPHPGSDPKVTLAIMYAEPSTSPTNI